MAEDAAVWTSRQRAELEGVCGVCRQPECERSTGGVRPAPGVIPERAKYGQIRSRGYSDVAVHPRMAVELLHRGSIVVNGQTCPVYWDHNEAFITALQVWGTAELGNGIQ